MSSIRAVRSHNIQKLHNLKNPFPLSHLIVSNPVQSSCSSSISLRPFSLSAFFSPPEKTEPNDSQNAEKKIKKTKKSLSICFREAVELIEKSEDFESESDSEQGELKERLWKLEVELRSLRDKRKGEKEKEENKKNQEKERVAKKDDGMLINEPKIGTLSAMFANTKEKMKESKDWRMENPEAYKKKMKEPKDLRMENPEVYKELSPDMEMFVKHLYKTGYFKDSNFLPRHGFDITCFENSYARDFIKFAAEQFGKDNQEIAKWLSGSDLKKVASFGCPSLARRNIFAAKRLRTFFRIQEDTVCSKCSLKESCKFVNQSVWKGDTKNLNLACVMRVLTLYALESAPSQLVAPDEIKASVGRLLMEVIGLSQTKS